MSVTTAKALGLVACENCGRVARAPRNPNTAASCPHCGAPLHSRFPASLARTWAYLIAACVLYIPANLLIMMHTSDYAGTRSDTIVSGVLKLWTDGAHSIALVVFIASVVVPMMKIGVMAYLAISVQLGWTEHQRLRAKMFRFIERIGHWSMLDVFVVALLVALVDFNVARVEPGPAALAFGVVVILTMLAAKSFDPRLIWDASAEEADTARSPQAS
jgi:paraquat-inducible protein A